VYVVVYIEFVGLGIGLMLAFFLYSKTRWAETLRSTTRAFQPGATHDVQVLLANAAALVAVALGGLYLAWAFGATVGLREGARRTLFGSLINGIDGALMMGAAAGVLMMVRRIGGRVPFWLPLAMTWVGTGSMFGWGLWQLINVLGRTAIMRGVAGTALVNLAGLLRLVVGLVMGLLMVFLLAERRASG
jgi:hypothetical protein